MRTDPVDLGAELARARRLAREAGALVMEHYGRRVAIERKARGEPVTAADRAANAFILDGLRESFPGDAILAEETPPGLDRLSAARVWMVDPLDGTKEFIARNGEFAVMIGLAIDARPVLGAVYRPTREELYLGIPGTGAWVETASGRRPLAVSEAQDPARMRLAVSRSHRSPSVDRMKVALGIREEAISGSVGVKIGMVATRECDLYLHPSGGSKEWDTCAPEAILVAAGGSFTDVFGDPIRYNKADVANSRGIVASNGRVHERIIREIAPYVDLGNDGTGGGG